MTIHGNVDWGDEMRADKIKREQVICPKAGECGDECFYPEHKIPHATNGCNNQTAVGENACPACIPVPSTPAKEDELENRRCKNPELVKKIIDSVLPAVAKSQDTFTRLEFAKAVSEIENPHTAFKPLDALKRTGFEDCRQSVLKLLEAK